MKLRVSLVDYLNAAPLGWALLHGPMKGQFEVIPSSPSICADQLASGEVDIGLIPSIEYQRIPDLHVIPGLAVGASNDVRSVIMVQPKGQTRIRSVALDSSSRTSVVLLKLLLEKKMGLAPEYVYGQPYVEEMLARSDAALIIGDTALQLSREEYEVLDLAEAWIAWQHRPFVFAFWACRSNLSLPANLVQVFHEAKDWGLAARDDIVRSYVRRLDLPADVLWQYLKHNIDYRFGPQHIDGLQRFFQLAFEADLIQQNRTLRFLSVGTKIESSV